VFVGDVRGQSFKSYVGFTEFVGAKILYALALVKPDCRTGAHRRTKAQYHKKNWFYQKNSYYLFSGWTTPKKGCVSG
jgi:hypothetical protein